MQDETRRRLRELEEALKEAERQAQLEKEDAWLREAKALIGEEPEIPIRNIANRYGRAAEPAESAGRTGAEMDDRDAVYVEKPGRKGAGGLVVLALLELIAIMLVILWWLRWMG